MSLKNRNRIQAVLDLATAADYAEGKAWYARALTAAQRLAEDYDITVKTAAGVITALSPRNKWDRNLLDAEKIISVYVSAGADEAFNVKVCTFTANKKKAIAILKSEEFTRIVGLNDVSRSTVTLIQSGLSVLLCRMFLLSTRRQRGLH